MKYFVSFGVIVVGLVLLWLTLSGKLETWVTALVNAAHAVNQPTTGTTAVGTNASTVSPTAGVGGVPTTTSGLASFTALPTDLLESELSQPSWPAASQPAVGPSAALSYV